MALVRDAFDNPVAGANVTFTGPVSGAGISPSPLIGSTNAAGLASVSATANATAGGPYNVVAASGSATTANFSLTNTAVGPAVLSALITNKTGTADARVWRITIGNTGTGSADSAQISGFLLTQTAGAECTPVVSTALPVSAGTIAPGGISAPGNITIDFSTCPALARFTAQAMVSANSGAATGSMTLFNQLR